MDRPWQIEMFGWLRAVQPDRAVTRFRTHKAGVLLAYLAYYPHRSHPREQLIELLWPECPLAAGQRNLRTELASLRRQLEPPGVPPGAVFLAHRETIQLNPAACVSDVALFEAALKAAEKVPSPAARVEPLLTAAELYRGELLPGYFEDWILAERQRLAETFLQALHELVALLEELGDRPRALQWARRAVAADPLCEKSREALIRLLVAAGQIEAARSQFEQGQQLLEQELGAGLSPEIHALIKELAPSKDRPCPAPPGKQRKPRRLGTPSQGAESPAAVPEPSPALAQDEEFAPVLPLPSAAARPSHNLPLRFTRFFGREAEIARLCEAVGCRLSAISAPTSGLDFTDGRRLTADNPRLITLTGPGGMGKTRLALEVAQQLRDAFAGGVWFASLLDLTDPALIPDQVLLSLRLPRSPHTEPLEQVVAFLSRAPALLLLDNFEHLVDGGAEIVGNLLEQVAHLAVLVTSRQCLGLEGEREFPVAPLPVPVDGSWLMVDGPTGAGRSDPSTINHQLSTLTQLPSVALFVDRAQAVRPDFQVTAKNAVAVGSLCQLLEGLPLAIELAAARIGVLTPQQMLARLEERFELLVNRRRVADLRHGSLRATLDWSYQLLAPELQRLFARLSVFRGGWSEAAAEAVCEEPRALDYLEKLRECSMLQTTETAREIRFHLLETLREYGAEQLAEAERAMLARRHAEFFLGLAELAEPELKRKDQKEWLDRLEREHDNLRAALAWASETGETQTGLQLAGALQEFWFVRSYHKEASDHLLHLLGLPGTEAHPAARAKALSGAGRFAESTGDLDTAQALHEESLAIWRRLDDRAGIATALRHLGGVTNHQPDLAASRALIEESLAIYRELGDQEGVAQSLLTLGRNAHAHWDLAAARVLIAESLAIWRELDEPGGIVRALDRLGMILFFQGEADAARALFDEELARATELGDRIHVAWSLSHLGWVAGYQEQWAAARALGEQSLVIWRELNVQWGLACTLFDLGSAIREQGDYRAAHAYLAEALAIARKWGSNRYITLILADLGMIAGDLGDWEQAVAHFTEGLRVSWEGQLRDQLIMARCLTGLGRVALARASPARAARLLGTAATLRAACSFSAWPGERRECARLVSEARSELDEAEFAAVWAEGEVTPLDDAIALALEEVAGG